MNVGVVAVAGYIFHVHSALWGCLAGLFGFLACFEWQTKKRLESLENRMFSLEYKSDEEDPADGPK